VNTARKRVSFPRTELPAGGRKLVKAGGREILVLDAGGALYALFAVCPHHRAPLVAGVVGDTALPSAVVGEFRRSAGNDVLFCPWHHYEFDLRTGRCIADERLRVATYEVREEGEEVAVYV
jgi:nitrite reductase/ring-hydroxylating ferredoxin subunit